MPAYRYLVGDGRRAWLAGLAEGEGAFVLHQAQPRFVLGMADEDVVREAHRLVGLGNIYLRPSTRPEWKPIWQWSITTGSDAAAFMLWLYPLLGKRRRERIREIIVPWLERPGLGHGHNKAKTHCPAGHPYSSENTYISRNGDGSTCRKCRTCHLARTRARRAVV